MTAPRTKAPADLAAILRSLAESRDPVVRRWARALKTGQSAASVK
jgi:hypothetical protein